jgi:hypothetical protein
MSGPEDQCTLSEIVDFLRETQTFMDQTHWVERYAWCRIAFYGDFIVIAEQ